MEGLGDVNLIYNFVIQEHHSTVRRVIKFSIAGITIYFLLVLLYELSDTSTQHPFMIKARKNKNKLSECTRERKIYLILHLAVVKENMAYS